MLDEEYQETYLDLLVEAYEKHEDNMNAFYNNRFGEIYLFDKGDKIGR